MPDETNVPPPADGDFEPAPPPEGLLVGMDEAVISSAVRKYVWGKGKLVTKQVYPGFSRALVARFLERELRAAPGYRFWRGRVVADVYHLTELTPFFEQYLNGRESTPDLFERSVVSVAILAESGDPTHFDFARRYYDFLVGQPLASTKLPELLECLAALGPGVSPEGLARRFQIEIEKLYQSGSLEDRPEARRLSDILDNDFYFLGEANKSEARLLSVPQGRPRLDRLIAIYLEITEDGGGEYLLGWAERQIRRTSEELGPRFVVEALLAVANAASGLPDSERIFRQVRCYRAMAYFSAVLESPQLTVVAKQGKNQEDPLQPVHPPPYEPPDVEEPEEEEPQ